MLSSAKNANLRLSTITLLRGEPAGSALFTDADARLGAGVGIGLSAWWPAESKTGGSLETKVLKYIHLARTNLRKEMVETAL